MQRLLSALCATALIISNAFPTYGAEPPAQLAAETPFLTRDSWSSGPLASPPRSRIWIDAAYYLARMNDANLPPLVTTSPASSLGVLGEPGTTVLFGGNTSQGDIPGLRINAGWWDDDCQKRGCELGLLYLPFHALRRSFSSTGDPLLARPFFDASLGMESSEIVAYDGSAGVPPLPVEGTVAISLGSELWSPELNRICNLHQSPCGRYRRDFLYGLRYLHFEEDLNIRELLDLPVLGGVRFDLTDRFRTKNQFLGAQIGVRRQWQTGRLRLEGTGKLALGAIRQTVTIDGQTIITDPVGGTTTMSEGGLLALPTNIGRYHRTTFAAIPELNLKAAWRWTSRLETYAGYDFLFVSNVVRPGEHIDRRVNTTQPPIGMGLVGPAVPAFSFNGTEFWMQGVSAGLRFNF